MANFNFNKAILGGRLVADPELKQTQSGIPVCSFRIAVSRRFQSKSADAQSQPQADFIDIVAWRSTGEFVSKYFTKGRMAVVEGRLQIRDWTDQNGNKRRTAEVVADNVYFGDSKRDSDGGSYSTGYGNAPGGYAAGGYAPSGYSAPAAPSGYGAAPMSDQYAELSDDDGELPF